MNTSQFSKFPSGRWHEGPSYSLLGPYANEIVSAANALLNAVRQPRKPVTFARLNAVLNQATLRGHPSLKGGELPGFHQPTNTRWVPFVTWLPRVGKQHGVDVVHDDYVGRTECVVCGKGGIQLTAITKHLASDVRCFGLRTARYYAEEMDYCPLTDFFIDSWLVPTLDIIPVYRDVGPINNKMKRAGVALRHSLYMPRWVTLAISGLTALPALSAPARSQVSALLPVVGTQEISIHRVGQLTPFALRLLHDNPEHQDALATAMRISGRTACGEIVLDLLHQAGWRCRNHMLENRKTGTFLPP